MKECWNTGDLRAYVDRELAPGETARLEAHLESCATCTERLREVSERAGRVSEMLVSLDQSRDRRESVSDDRKGAVRATWGKAAALASAACLALVFLAPKPAPPPKTAQVARPFIALDNEPIETGMVVRVAFGPDQVQADVIITPDGRPRAYRLVENPSINQGVKTE
jgi:hypothetical protein